jgi:SNF2 family DNA or RNA helicase
MGIGKTATAIRAMDLVLAKRVIIVVPASIRSNWVKEIAKFSYHPRRVCVGRSRHDFVAFLLDRFDVLVASYEGITAWADEIRRQVLVGTNPSVDLMIIDESHYLKNPQTARTKAIYGEANDFGLVSVCRRVWALTGTPTPNDPVDIYGFLRMTRAFNLSHSAFVNRYFLKRKTAFGSRQTYREDMLPELKQLVTNNAIRRMKKEVGFQLPPIFLHSLYLDGDCTEVTSLLKEHPDLENSIKQAVEEGGLSHLNHPHIATLRRLVGQAKAVPYAKLLIEEVQSDPESKRVVMGIHRDVLSGLLVALEQKGISAVLVNGGTPDKLKDVYVESFQTDPNCRVFIGNILSAGTGLTLTASCEIDMLESDWTPANNAQALMRIHRIGQTRNVSARFITLSQSVDDAVLRVVREKTHAIAALEGEAMNATPLDTHNISV